jgi:hypothetical protein
MSRSTAKTTKRLRTAVDGNDGGDDDEMTILQSASKKRNTSIESAPPFNGGVIEEVEGEVEVYEPPPTTRMRSSIPLSKLLDIPRDTLLPPRPRLPRVESEDEEEIFSAAPPKKGFGVGVVAVRLPAMERRQTAPKTLPVLVVKDGGEDPPKRSQGNDDTLANNNNNNNNNNNINSRRSRSGVGGWMMFLTLTLTLLLSSVTAVWLYERMDTALLLTDLRQQVRTYQALIDEEDLRTHDESSSHLHDLEQQIRLLKRSLQSTEGELEGLREEYRATISRLEQ